MSEIRTDLILSRMNTSQRQHLAKLNKQQYRAVMEILNWSITPAFTDRARILAGYAGTGKTFCASLIASFLPKAVMVAPTNKAVKEIRRQGTSLPSMTIYSLFGLRMETHEDQVRLVKANNEVNSIRRYKYVVLDEAGMLSKILMPYIEDAMRAGVRFLMIGDPAQLPPVGEDQSVIWGRYPTNRLTKVERHDNQILSFATHIRRSKLKDIKFKSKNADGQGVWHMEHHKFIRSIEKFAKRGLFINGKAKAIAWRNRTVDELNTIVRATIFGEESYDYQYIKGDIIVFTSPYNGDDTKITVDDEATVEHVVEAKHTNYDLLCNYLTLKLEDGKTTVVKAIHRDSEKKLSRMLAELSNAARQSNSPREFWASFWELKESMAYVRPSYALTAHRAQGSTYSNVLVDSLDILSNPNDSEAKKCLYVAATRPSKRLLMT